MWHKNLEMNYENIKLELGDLINECTHENFYKGYDPFGDLISNKEEIDYDDFENKLYYIDTLEAYSKEYNEIMSLLDNLKPGDKFYKKVFILDLYGELFYYSKFHEDLFKDSRKKEVGPNDRILVDHYSLDDFIMNFDSIEDEDKIQDCLYLVEDDWGIFED